MTTRQPPAVEEPPAIVSMPIDPRESIVHTPNQVKVSVRFNPDLGTFTIDSSHQPIPTFDQVFKHLPPSIQRGPIRHYCNNSYDTQTIMQQNRVTVPNNIWAEAIAKATVCNINASVPGEAALSNFDDDCYMAVGTMLYKLTPIASTRTNKALSAVRRNALDKAKADAAHILDSAEKNAATITRAASVLKETLERERRNKNIPPAWATDAGLPLKFRSYDGASQWCVGFTFDYLPERIVYTAEDIDINLITQRNQRVLKTRSWSLVTGSAPVRTFVWVPLLNIYGTVSVNQCHLQSGFGYLPHIREDRACLAPADIPQQIQNYEHFKAFKESFIRCMNGDITLNSLLCGFLYLPPSVVAWFPPDVVQYIRTYGISNSLWNHPTITTEGTLTSVPIEQERAQTWTQQ